MKTFLKVLAGVLLAIIAIKLLPFVLPVVALALPFLLIGGLLFGAVAAVAGVSIAVVAVLLVVALILLAVLSPIWIPVAAVIGLVALIRRSGRSVA